jgi:hypothetical protein
MKLLSLIAISEFYGQNKFELDLSMIHSGMLTAVLKKGGIWRIFTKNFWRITYEKGGKRRKRRSFIFCRAKRVLYNFKLINILKMT